MMKRKIEALGNLIQIIRPRSFSFEFGVFGLVSFSKLDLSWIADLV